MKKSVLFFTFIFILSSLIPAQKIIENPGKPTSKNAGRIVELKEEMSIDDIGADYYFKHPRNPKVAPDGSLFISDHEQLLQFGQEGNFLRNYFNKGQGPAEMQDVRNYFFADNNIIVHDGRLQKILWFSLNGEYIKEFRIHELPTFTWLHLFYNNTFYFIGHRIPSTEGKASVINVPYDLISATEGGQGIDKLTSFPVESLVISSSGAGMMATIAELITAPYKEKYLVVCHTQEYLLKIYDVESKKTIRSFKRKYKRVKVPPGRSVGGSLGHGGKTYRPPRTHLNDINKIFVNKELLWIMTSKTDEKKGVLIDVFDFEGRYTDNFYLKIPGKIDSISIIYTSMTLSEDLLYMRVRNEDETISFKKYRIEDKGSK